MSKDIIFPLVLRPIAGLWLSAPRSVHKFFGVTSKYYYSNYSIDEKCFLQQYSHREERRKYNRTTALCKELHNTYPYIQRKCYSDYCMEYLMLNDYTPLYVLKMIKDEQ